MVYENINDLDFNIADVMTQTTIMDNDFGLPHRGYFGNSITDIQGAINRGDDTSLTSIRGVFNEKRYVSDAKENYQYFLPLERVKKKVRVHYRPFETVEEMEEYLEISVGDAICLRSTTASDMLYKVMYIGCTPNGDMIGLGIHIYTLEELFNRYEFSKDGEEWCTFGMLEKVPNAKDHVPQPPSVINDTIKAIQDHVVSLDTDNLSDYIGITGYFFDIDDYEEIARKITNGDHTDCHFGTFDGVSAASIMYPLLCVDSDGHENNWKFFIPEKYLKGLK